jgi:hypothetical protein
VSERFIPVLYQLVWFFFFGFLAFFFNFGVHASSHRHIFHFPLSFFVTGKLVINSKATETAPRAAGRRAAAGRILVVEAAELDDDGFPPVGVDSGGDASSGRDPWAPGRGPRVERRRRL